MEMPIPEYVEELCKDFEQLFKQKRQMAQFKRLMTGFAMGDKHTIAHINGLFLQHTDQSNLNRFVHSSEIEEMNRIKISLINRTEKKGVVVLDDYIVEKYGKNIFGAEYHYDHSKGRNVWGLEVADCVFSGNGILSALYGLCQKG
jgi:hypothetical protein